MKIGSLFAGIGGFDLGFQEAGFETAWACEIDLSCRKLLANKFPKARLHDDITTFNPADFECPSIITFGFPCTDLSVAGKREGLKSGETRSGLFYEATRIISGFVRRGLRFAIAENVPGMFSSDGGRDFARILGTMGKLGATDIAWATLDCQWWGLAQRRKRVFIVADFGGECAEEILSVREGLCWHPPPSRETGKKIAPTIEGRAGRSSANNFATSGGLVDCARRLRAQPQSSHREDSDTFIPVTANPIGSHHRRDNLDNDTYVLAHGQSNGEIVRDGEPSLTCNHEAPIAITPIQSVNMVLEKKQNGIGIGNPGDEMFTLTGRDQHAIAFSSKDSGNDATNDLAPTLRSQNFKDSHMNGGGQVAVCATITKNYATHNGRTAGNNGGVAEGQLQPVGLMVRRLTPTECERLMGFPDGWTEGFSDSVRYRMIGNSLAVTVAKWIAERIKIVLARKPDEA